MPFPNDTLLNIGVAAMQAAATHVAIGDGPLSTDVTSSSRQPITWVTAADGDMVVTADLAFTGTPGAGATYALFFSASSGGTFYGERLLTGAVVFDAAGNYVITGGTITGTSTGT